jgi:hypothetical protein
MKLTQRPGFIAFITGSLLLIAAVWLFLWAWSSAALRCVTCDCRYALGAANPDCRLPALLSLFFYATLAGGLAAIVFGWFRRRSKRTAA